MNVCTPAFKIEVLPRYRKEVRTGVISHPHSSNLMCAALHPDRVGPEKLLDNELHANIELSFYPNVGRGPQRQWSAGMPKASTHSRRCRRALIYLASFTDCLALAWRQGNAR
jgi:hypothetical protein